MPLMRPEQMYQVGVGLGSAEMQGQEQAMSLYGHLMRNQLLANELQKQKAIRDIAATVPQTREVSLQSTTMPQGMTGMEEYVPAETQTQKVQIPTTMHERLASIGDKIMGIDPEHGLKFLTAADALRKTNDPMEKAIKFSTFLKGLRGLPKEVQQMAFKYTANSPEWMEMYGKADPSKAFATSSGDYSVPSFSPITGELLGYNILDPDGTKWHYERVRGDKYVDWGYGQKKNVKTGEIEKVPVKPEKDISTEWDRRQAIKDQAQFKKEQKDVLDDYTRDVQKLRGRYDASVRSGIPMTTEDWNGAMQEIVDQYEPKFKRYNIQFGKPSNKEQAINGGKDEFGYAIGETQKGYKYIGNNKWQRVKS